MNTQATSIIFALPAEVCLYKRIQKFDIVRVLAGPFVDTIGFVDEVYHGTGWYMVKTPSRCLRLYRANIELEDRLCVDDFVRVVHGPFLGKQGTVRKVDVKGNIEIATLPSNVSQASLAQPQSILNSTSLMTENSLPSR